MVILAVLSFLANVVLDIVKSESLMVCIVSLLLIIRLSLKIKYTKLDSDLLHYAIALKQQKRKC